ncbi:helix-turn-helix domain-containing protein [Clostridium neonatale]|uniref:helix-turn-helix domain-containing protein n=1 Tax=Clostridium neonatale TaxID=137838 RepID=UPI00291BD39E|nr:hypothetical protein CNEO3_200050 [Clostridium neonatale]
MNDNSKEIGNKIKSIRKNKNLTRKELADKLGVSVYTVRNYEVGQRGYTLRTLNKIANALDVPVSEFVVSPEDYSEDIRPFVPASLYKGKEYTDNLFDELLSIEKQIRLYEDNADFNSLINCFSNYIQLLKDKIEKTEEYHKQKKLGYLKEITALKKIIKEYENK